MYVDYMLFVVIALVTELLTLIRILSSGMKYQEKGFLQLIVLAVCHNIVDIFWGLTYFDKIGMGPLGLQISTSLYFCSNAVLAFTWFAFLYRMLNREEPKKWVLTLAAIPMVTAFIMVIANIWTGLLFTIGDTVNSYARGDWYIIERIETSGYLIVIFVWTVIKLFRAKDKSERKKYSVITLFAIVPLTFDFIQLYFISVPCTSVAFQIAIFIVYAFISVDRSKNVLLSVSERQKSNLKTALVETAMSWYEFNVDSDCIYDSKIYIDRTHYVDSLKRTGKKYSEYYEFFANRVLPEFNKLYRETFSLENLRNKFQAGESEISLRYWIKDDKGEELYILKNIIMTKDEVTGETIGFVYTKDITHEELHKREIEQKLEEIEALNTQLEKKQKEYEDINEELSRKIDQIQSMSKVYFASFYVDIAKDTFVEINSVPSVRDKIGASGSAQEALNILCDKMVTPETAENLREAVDLSTIRERMRDTDVITAEYVSLASGWCRFYVISGDRDADGNVKTLFLAARNIREEKLREEKQNRKMEEARIEAERASKVKTDFLFNMSHDIRTPMNAIIGYTELLKGHLDDRKLAEDYIGKIETANDFLLSLINNVLEMARIESGKVVLDESASNIHAFWNGLHALFEAQIKNKGITCSCNIHIEHSDIIVDETKAREMLLNILSNAVKYTPQGGSVSVSVTELPSEKPGYATYKTVVRDTGIGMSREYLPHIFEEFSREHTSTESKVAGTGLGMPIVKKLVDLMGGSISVESELGVGTEFTLILSHRIANAGNEAPMSEHSDDYKDNGFAGKRILIAEDNELNAEIAITILQEMGFAVDYAEDGFVCVDMLQKADPDYYALILMDIQMPNIDGYKATRIIRRLPDPKKANIPIFAMTANAFEEDRKKAFSVGMNGHIAKPIQIEILKNTIGYLLSSKEEEQEVYASRHAYFSECDAFNSFKAKYNKQGNALGCLVYEANGEEKILYADETLIKMFGCCDYTEFFEYVGGSFKTFVHPDDIERAELEIANQVYNSEDLIDRVKYRILPKGGEIRRVDSIGRKVFTKNGSPVFCVCIVDVTD